jgi:hypothetical protein
LAAPTNRRGGLPEISFLTIGKCTRRLGELKPVTKGKRKRR